MKLLLTSFGYCDCNNIIFLSIKGGWAQNRKIIWAKLAQENITHPHNLRHTYASECLRRGKNIMEVKELLGHENIATTNIYTKLSIPDDVATLLDG
ncbi:MAG: tyrosine-type recombinase/integrase [Desulfobacterales bacterium]|nr:tyrosine-type recombinase/integrase [Desulfobacterales bacterium]